MKILLLLISTLLLISCDKSPNPEKMTDDEKISYALGYIATKQIKTTMGSDLIPEMMQAGLKDSLEDKTPVLQEDEAYMLLNAKQMKKAEVMKEKNAKEQEEFIKTLTSKEGILKTESGVFYEFVGAKKNGKTPKLTDVVKVHYSGAFINGKVFDSSEGQEPVEFRLNEVIKGWGDALQLVPVGNTVKLYIPAGLAYGEKGVPGFIEPNQMLVFDITLLDIIKAKK